MGSKKVKAVIVDLDKMPQLHERKKFIQGVRHYASKLNEDPAVQARDAESHGYAPTDSRAIALQPEALASDPILHPAAELMNGLEFGAAQTLTDPNRAELIARFKSA